VKKIVVSENYDYVGVYLTDKCHLRCPYCITRHHNSQFGNYRYSGLTPSEWAEGLNRFVLPKDVPISLQGGEPFLYYGIWELLDQIEHKVDIMTALPPFVTKKNFHQLRTLNWNKRDAPYPTIRVSYHKGQNNYQELIERIAELQEILSIGLYYLDHPAHTEEDVHSVIAYAKKHKVELRKKDFLGEYKGTMYGEFLYPDAVSGKCQGIPVACRNTVVPIAPDGTIFRCHSDLYFNRKELAIGHILYADCQLRIGYLSCSHYGLCSECDIKIKNNHLQQYGYTSVDIRFKNEEVHI